MPQTKALIPIEDYVLDVLMRDLTGHDKHPAAFIAFLHLYGLAARRRWRPVPASLRDIADGTGLSKSAVQIAMDVLRRRQLVITRRKHRTATPEHKVLRHWA